MIDVALLSVIRRWHFRDGMPIREITRRTGLSRNTVRKYLASGVVEPRYPNRSSPSKLDDYELTLTSWLFRESRRHRKQRKTLKVLADPNSNHELDPRSARQNNAKVVEAIQEIGAHGGDHEQRAVGILQRGGEQTVEAAPLVRIGKGEQLLELIHREQEGGVVRFSFPQPIA